MKRFVTLFGVCSIIYLWSGSVVAQTVRDCVITASGEFDSGEVFDGTASDIVGVELINWMHDASGISFVTMLADPDGIECRLNGTTSADFLGGGTASVNGVPGHSYFIEIEDNRPAPSGADLVAMISYGPTSRTDGTVDFATPQIVVIPDDLDVLVGGSGSGWTKLILTPTVGEVITCRYRGTGLTYGFVRCTDPLNSGFVAGDSLDITQARLRIQQSDRDLGTTVVEAEIAESVPAPGDPDFYAIRIFAPDGAVIYDFAAALVDGDIDIELLP